MDTSKLVVGQKVWMQSGDLFKEATVTEITEKYIDVEPDPVGNEYRYFRRFDKSGKKQLGGNGGPDAWDPRPLCTKFGPWELEEREWKDMSTNEYLYFSTDDGKTWRRMEDDVSSRESMCRISFAHIVQVKLDNGELYEVEFGKFTQLRSPQ